MPLCHSKEEQVTTEDLVELSEIEKHNLGQVYIYVFYFCQSCSHLAFLHSGLGWTIR
jgi:hypothetical protein